jgi:hypothetical protein
LEAARVLDRIAVEELSGNITRLSVVAPTGFENPFKPSL